MKDHFAMFAGYNRWANRLLYAAAAAVPGDEYLADHGAFFGSLHGTLNHLLVGDRIWMRRFTGKGDAPDRLDAILFDDLGALAEARAAEDERIAGWIDGLSEDDLARTISYRMISRPVEITQPLGPALAHMFNHQTHHRGQCHALLTRIGGRDAAPSLDLLVYQRDAAPG